MPILPSHLPEFAAAAVLLAFVPGPDVLFVLTQAILRGRRAGFTAMAGLANGLVLHTCLVAFGVAALLTASPVAFAVLRYAGTAYLLFLAWRMIRSSEAGSGVRPG